MKKDYDHIVVGGGISGLTAALLLARQGMRVLLLEKGPRLGGSLARFTRRGVPFDVGFHFTGGFTHDRTGLLDDMLALLGIRDAIKPQFLPDERCHVIAFPTLDAVFEIPCGSDRYRSKLKGDFPGQARSLDEYFDRMTHVCSNTQALSVRRLGRAPAVQTQEDYIPLQKVLDELFEDRVLHALLSVFCMCHGSRPDEISFADHCRIAHGLYESTARISDGGDALLNAFRDAFSGLDIDIRCNTTVEELCEIRDRRVGMFLLTDGSEVGAGACIFTIHPWKILELLPDKHITPAFRHRVEGFEPSAGFFSMFGVLNGRSRHMTDGSVFSIFPDTDMNLVMSPRWDGPRPMVLLSSRENTRSGPVTALSALELSVPEEVDCWRDSKPGDRDEAYAAYKNEKMRSMSGRIARYCPTFSRDFTLLETASMLTYRDYLHSPFGSAYGIKQKVGQFNLVGRMPLVNLYAAGQSSMLPGVVGAMTSALLVVRNLTGKKEFQDYVEKCFRPAYVT